MWLYYSNPSKERWARRVMRLGRWLRDHGMRHLAKLIWRQVNGVCWECGQNCGNMHLIFSWRPTMLGKKRSRRCFDCDVVRRPFEVSS